MINRSPAKDDCLSPINNNKHHVIPILNNDQDNRDPIHLQSRYQFKSLPILIMASIGFIAILCLSFNNKQLNKDDIPIHSNVNDRDLLTNENGTTSDSFTDEGQSTSAAQSLITDPSLRRSTSDETLNPLPSDYSITGDAESTSAAISSTTDPSPRQINDAIKLLYIYNQMITGLEKKKQHLFWALLHDSSKWGKDVERFVPYYWKGNQTAIFVKYPSNSFMIPYLETRKQIAQRTWNKEVKHVATDLASKLRGIHVPVKIHHVDISDIVKRLHHIYPNINEVKELHDYRFNRDAHRKNFDELVKLQSIVTAEIFKSMAEAIFESHNFMQEYKDIPDWELEKPDETISEYYYRLNWTFNSDNTMYYKDDGNKWRLSFIKDRLSNGTLKIHENGKVKVHKISKDSGRISKIRPPEYVPRDWSYTEMHQKAMKRGLDSVDEKIKKSNTYHQFWNLAKKIANTIHLYHSFNANIERNNGPKELFEVKGFDWKDSVFEFVDTKKRILIKKYETGEVGEYRFEDEMDAHGPGFKGVFRTITPGLADTSLGHKPGFMYLEADDHIKNNLKNLLYDKGVADSTNRLTWEQYGSDPKNPPVYRPFEQEYSRVFEFFSQDVTADYIGLFRSIKTLIDLAHLNDIGDYRQHTKQSEHDQQKLKDVDVEYRAKIGSFTKEHKDWLKDSHLSEWTSGPLSWIMHGLASPAFVPSAMAFNEFVFQCKAILVLHGVPLTIAGAMCYPLDYGTPLFLHFIGNWYLYGISRALTETKRTIVKEFWDPSFYRFMHQPESLLLPNIFKDLNALIISKEIYQPNPEGQLWIKVPEGTHYLYGKFPKKVDHNIYIQSVHNDETDLEHFYIELWGITNPKGTFDVYSPYYVIITKPLGYILINDIIGLADKRAPLTTDYDDIQLPF